MNKIVKLTLILFLVCAIVAGVLGGINELTKGPIAEQKAIKTAKAYAAVLESESYEQVDSAKYSADPTIDAVEKASNGNGYVVQTTFSGAQGSITMVVGVDNDYKCTGISIISHSETSGLGAIAASSSERGEQFRDSFIGQDDTITVDDIDALTGATITSKAVADAVANAINVVESLG